MSESSGVKIEFVPGDVLFRKSGVLKGVLGRALIDFTTLEPSININPMTYGSVSVGCTAYETAYPNTGGVSAAILQGVDLTSSDRAHPFSSEEKIELISATAAPALDKYVCVHCSGCTDAAARLESTDASLIQLKARLPGAHAEVTGAGPKYEPPKPKQEKPRARRLEKVFRFINKMLNPTL